MDSLHFIERAMSLGLLSMLMLVCNMWKSSLTVISKHRGNLRAEWPRFWVFQREERPLHVAAGLACK